MRQHVGAVVAICAVSDLVLIAAGVAGIGTVVAHAGWALDVVRWLGVAFLTSYGVLSLWRARHPGSLRAADSGETGLRGAVLRATVLTWLNPHVYLDTLLLLGSVANHQGAGGRWWFAAGAGLASIVWFSGLGYGARYASRWLSSATAWRVLDLLIGLVMLGIALELALG